MPHMRIVQSFWSLPAQQNNRQDQSGRYAGGWISERFHAMSWALSCLTFKRHYKEIELYTDQDGARWLIDKLALPYTNVVPILDEINHYDPVLWALAKTYTCLHQASPFLHADGDVYIWQPFDKGFLNSPVFAQNIEYDPADTPHGIYIHSIKKLQKILSYIPPFLTEVADHYQEKGRIAAVNTGIMGGQHLAFLQSYARTVFDFLDRNRSVTFDSSDMNLVEQLFLFCLAKNEDIPVQYLFGEEKAVSETGYASMIQFNLVPIVKKYIHLVGFGKKREDCCSQVALRLKYEFPAMYDHIDALYKPSSSFSLATSSLPASGNSLDTSSPPPPGTSSSPSSGASLDTGISMNMNTAALEDLGIFQGLPSSRSDKNTENKLLDLLYTSGISGFLDQPFTLNTPFVKLEMLNYRYPPAFPLDDLPGIVSRQQTHSQDLFLLSRKDSDTIEVKPISPWEAMLAYFEGTEINGHQLIELLKEEGVQQIDDLPIFVLSFLTINSLYYNHLKLMS